MVALIIRGILLLFLFINPKNDGSDTCINLLFINKGYEFNFTPSLLSLKAESGNSSEDEDLSAYGAYGGYCIECENEGNTGLCTHHGSNVESYENGYCERDEGYTDSKMYEGDNSNEQTTSDVSSSGNIFVRQVSVEELSEAEYNAINDLAKINEIIEKNFISERNELLLAELCETLLEAIKLLIHMINEYSNTHKENSKKLRELSKIKGNPAVVNAILSANQQMYHTSLILKVRLKNLKLKFSKHCISYMEQQEFLIKQTKYGKYMSTQTERAKLRGEYQQFFLPAKTGTLQCILGNDSKHCNKNKRCKGCKDLLDKFDSDQYKKQLKKLCRIEKEYQETSKKGELDIEKAYCSYIAKKMKEYLDSKNAIVKKDDELKHDDINGNGEHDDGGHDNGGYDDEEYDDEEHDDGGHDNGGYDDEEYDNGEYDDGEYDTGGYDNRGKSKKGSKSRKYKYSITRSSTYTKKSGKSSGKDLQKILKERRKRMTEISESSSLTSSGRSYSLSDIDSDCFSQVVLPEIPKSIPPPPPEKPPKPFPRRLPRRLQILPPKQSPTPEPNLEDQTSPTLLPTPDDNEQIAKTPSKEDSIINQKEPKTDKRKYHKKLTGLMKLTKINGKGIGGLGLNSDQESETTKSSKQHKRHKKKKIHKKFTGLMKLTKINGKGIGGLGLRADQESETPNSSQKSTPENQRAQTPPTKKCKRTSTRGPLTLKNTNT
ncbi:signal peptide protein [Cryptosporidium ryanae]|uniref:signal peptide protein n=1 Tax=Cryptosporidium ryanae TaxID=515981 RepID=UPI00351A2C98|nr:signal peptide protein [Cryptosporidium ryanae]